MAADATATQEQHVQAEVPAASITEPAPRRSRARLWLAAMGFLLAAAIVLAGVHGPDVHAHRLQMAASSRRLRSYQQAAQPSVPATNMPKKYARKEGKNDGDSASKKALRNRKSGGGRLLRALQDPQ